MKVVWTDRAKLRLREIHAYIAQDSPNAASRVIRRLVERSRQLEILPHSGRAVPEYQRRDMRD
jgi:plasmid stabilization system protein ParE